MSLPAACAAQKSRTILFLGPGAFQERCLDAEEAAPGRAVKTSCKHDAAIPSLKPMPVASRGNHTATNIIVSATERGKKEPTSAARLCRRRGFFFF